jgi:hypothetical protein
MSELWRSYADTFSKVCLTQSTRTGFDPMVVLTGLDENTKLNAMSKSMFRAGASTCLSVVLDRLIAAGRVLRLEDQLAEILQEAARIAEGEVLS